MEAVLSEWCTTDLPAARKALEASGLDATALGQELMALVAPPNAMTRATLALARDPFLSAAGLYQSLESAGIDWEKSFPLPGAINRDGWYTPDPATAASEAEKLPPGKIRDAIFNAIAENWLVHDPQKACEFADQHGIKIAERELQKFPGVEMREAASADPEGTFAELMSTAGGNGSARSGQLRTLALEWARMDPEGVSEWLIEEMENRADPSAPFDPNLLFSSTLGYSWAKFDANEAITWMDELPDGPAKSAAWLAMSPYVSEEYSPDLAFEISAQVADGEVRSGLLKQSLLEINRTIGAPAALAHLDSPDLSAEESAALRQTLQDANRNSPQ